MSKMESYPPLLILQMATITISIMFAFAYKAGYKK